MNVSKGDVVRGGLLFIGLLLFGASSIAEEAVILTIVSISLIVISLLSFVINRNLSKVSCNSRFALAFAVFSLSLGVIASMLTDWSPSRTNIPWFVFIYIGISIPFGMIDSCSTKEEAVSKRK